MEYRNTIKLDGLLEAEPDKNNNKKPDRKKPKKKRSEKNRTDRNRDHQDRPDRKSDHQDRFDRKSDSPEAEKKKRKRHRSFVAVLDVILGLAIIVIVTYILSQTVFQITKISVEGNTIWDDNYIREKTIVDNDYKSNALYQLGYRLIKPVKGIPFVDSVKLSLKSPSHLLIKVKEKELLGMIPSADGKFIYFNDDGCIQEISEKRIEGVLPVEGLLVEKPKAGETLSVGNDCLKALLNVVKSLKKYDIKVESLNFRDNVEVECKIGSVNADLGDFDYINEKVMRLSIILPKLEGYAGILHLENWTPDSTDVIFEIAE